MIPLVAAHAVLTIHLLTQGVKAVIETRAGAFFDAWVLIPIGANPPAICGKVLRSDLEPLGLEPMDDDEIDPELTCDGLKVYCAQIGGEAA